MRLYLSLHCKYIELANVGMCGEITGCTEALGYDLPTRARKRVQAGDLIVSSIEGSLQSCAIIPAEYEGAFCSTGFHVLKPLEINAETLLILFKLPVYQQLLKKGCSGTILTAIQRGEFTAIRIPLIDKKIQKEIAQKVQESFALREESKRLLEAAKTAVEMAIEKDEATALKYLHSGGSI